MQQLEMIAHRGYSAIAPENTLAAFSTAIQKGANSIELDVQLSSDGIFVIIHDSTLDRTTNGTGNVREKTLEQLRALDAGSWFAPQFSSERIPTLQEVLYTLKVQTDSDGLKQYIYLDVKQDEPWSSSEVSELVQTVIQTGWEDRCIIASFTEQLYEQVRHQSKRIVLGYFVVNSNTYQAQLTKASADGNAIIMSRYSVLLENPSLVQSSRNQGVDVVAWTVDSQEYLQQLAEIGVVRIVTNSLLGHPEIYCNALNS